MTKSTGTKGINHCREKVREGEHIFWVVGVCVLGWEDGVGGGIMFYAFNTILKLFLVAVQMKMQNSLTFILLKTVLTHTWGDLEAAQTIPPSGRMQYDKFHYFSDANCRGQAYVTQCRLSPSECEHSAHRSAHNLNHIKVTVHVFRKGHLPSFTIEAIKYAISLYACQWFPCVASIVHPLEVR